MANICDDSMSSTALDDSLEENENASEVEKLNIRIHYGLI